MNMETNLLDQITKAIEGDWDIRQSFGAPIMAFYNRFPQGLYAGWSDAELYKMTDGTVKVTFWVCGMPTFPYTVHTVEEATDLFDKRYSSDQRQIHHETFGRIID